MATPPTSTGLKQAGTDPLAHQSHALRQAREIRTVRRLAKQAFFGGGAVWGLLLGGRAYFEKGFGASPNLSLALALTVLIAVGCGVLGALVLRSGPWQPGLASGGAALSLYWLSVVDWTMVAGLAAVAAGLALGWSGGSAVALLRRAVPSGLRVAAGGWVALSVLSGVVLGALALQSSTSLGVKVGTAWLAGYAAVATIPAVLVARSAPGDDDRARARERTAIALASEASTADVAPLLDVQGVELSYGLVQVLFGVNLQLGRGELLGLLGTNGAGKSTVLKAITGFHRPSRGSIAVEGREVTGFLPEEIAELGVALVPGGRPIFPELTVKENLRMGAFLVHRRSASFERATAEVFDLFPRLAARRQTSAGALSGGERQMLAIAQSLYGKPKVMLIDELSLGLAPAVVGELVDTVKAIAADGTGVVLVEQSVNIALSVVERAVFLEKGEVRFSGPARELLDRPDVVRSVFLEGAARHVVGNGVGT